MPLSDLLSLYTLVTYMRPAIGPGPLAAEHDEWSFAIGLAVYPRHDSRTATVANRGWAALIPVANNSTFFVDTNQLLLESSVFAYVNRSAHAATRHFRSAVCRIGLCFFR